MFARRGGRGGRGKGRGRGRGREGYPIGTSASALAFAHSLLDDRSEPATAKVLLLSWVPAWKQLAPHGPPTRREGEVRRCGALNVTFSARRELLRHGGFDAIANAFNRNLALDDFILWQVAGDLLPSPTIEQNVATGFVRMNPSTAEGGAIPAEFQCKNNFDRTESLGTVLLGMTMSCARCHTHKYDPITHTEYYQLLAFFNSTSESPMDGNKSTKRLPNSDRVLLGPMSTW